MTTVNRANRKRAWRWLQIVAALYTLATMLTFFVEAGRLLALLPGLLTIAFGVGISGYAMTRNGRRWNDGTPVEKEQSRIMTSGVLVMLIGMAWTYVVLILALRDRF